MTALFRRERGQLVLLAAVALAAALVPLAVAYLQLGYQATVDADRSPLQGVRGTLDRALVDAAGDVPNQYPWSDRTAAVTAVRDGLRPTLASLNTSRLAAGRAVVVTYNATRSQIWAGSHCPAGPARQFGPCRVDRGVVVQDRAGKTHVLAVAVDVAVAGPNAEQRAVMVVSFAR